MLAKLQPWQQALLDAAEIIKTRGLRKFDVGVRGGPRCTVGAVCEASGPLGLRDSLEEEVWRRFEATTGIRDVVAWTDAPERTADEVIKALQEAAL